MTAPPVVIGIGNPLRGDDGVGIAVARRLREHPPPGVRMVESGADPADLLDAWTGAAVAVVVDAVRTGSPPGSVHRVDIGAGARLPRPAVSGHTLDLEHAAALGAVLGRMPARLVLVGIAVEHTGLGDGLSEAVAAAVDPAAALVREELAGSST